MMTEAGYLEAISKCSKCRFNRQGGMNTWSDRCTIFCGPHRGMAKFEPFEEEAA